MGKCQSTCLIVTLLEGLAITIIKHFNIVNSVMELEALPLDIEPVQETVEITIDWAWQNEILVS